MDLCRGHLGHRHEPGYPSSKSRRERSSRIREDLTLPLKEVARQSGFTDLSALGKAFRLKFGVTPGDYRAHFGD